MRARDIARGMAYLHAHSVCHGDLKPENALLQVRPAVCPLHDLFPSRADACSCNPEALLSALS